MNKEVKIEFDEILSILKKIEANMDNLKTEMNNTIADITHDTEAWEARYQKIFDRHLEVETQKTINTIIKNCTRFNTYLRKTIDGYRKIDNYR